MSIQSSVNSAIGIAGTMAGLGKIGGNTVDNATADLKAAMADKDQNIKLLTNMNQQLGSKLNDQQKAYLADMNVAYNLIGAKNIRTAFLNRMNAAHSGDYVGYMDKIKTDVKEYEVRP